MLEKRFFKYVAAQAEEIRTDEMPNMCKAADMIADAVAQGGNCIVYDRGHLIGRELLFRAGGPAFIRRLDLDIPMPYLTHSTNGTRKATRSKLSGEALKARKRRFDVEYIDYLFDLNGFGAGDVLLLNSNSGYGFLAVAVAKIAKEKGMKLILITSLATANAVTPEGGEGKVLDYADIILDNHAPFGDAVFEVMGLTEKIWPASGMGAAYIAWPLMLMVTQRLVDRGLDPAIYRSTNIPGGPEQNVEALQHYEDHGY